MSANTADIYRSGRSPPSTPDVAGVVVDLTPVGSSALRTTAYHHVLTLPVGTDIRDDFNTGSSSFGSAADKVYIPDKTGTQWRVLIVRRVGWTGTSADYLHALLCRVPGSAVGFPTNNL